VIAVSAASCAPGTAAPDPGAHRDGEGILASENEPDAGWEFAIADDQTPASETLGLRLCVADGVSSPVIERVLAHGTIGAPPSFLGASIRTFRPSAADTPILGTVGYPPPVPDVLVPAVGSTITTPCGAKDQYTELLIGLAPPGEAGGGWTGEVIRYAVGNRRYDLVLDYRLLFCGSGLRHPSC
jgi:hypothetical protein